MLIDAEQPRGGLDPAGDRRQQRHGRQQLAGVVVVVVLVLVRRRRPSVLHRPRRTRLLVGLVDERRPGRRRPPRPRPPRTSAPPAGTGGDAAPRRWPRPPSSGPSSSAPMRRVGAAGRRASLHSSSTSRSLAGAARRAPPDRAPATDGSPRTAPTTASSTGVAPPRSPWPHQWARLRPDESHPSVHHGSIRPMAWRRGWPSVRRTSMARKDLVLGRRRGPSRCRG